MKNTTATFLIISTLLLSGCETLPPKDQLASADYGSAPDNDKTKYIAKQLILKTLLDPYSAVVSCGNLMKGVVNIGFRNRYGYLLECQVNAKNRFGAYTGSEPVFFWIRNGGMENIDLPFDFEPAK